MDSYHKIIIALLVSFLMPVLSFAQNQDYLSVTGTLLNSQISLESVEQRVFNQSDAVVYRSGSYEARVIKGKKIISNNFFEIVENPELWIDIEGNKPEDRFKSNKTVFNVKLPLTENLDTANSIIEIWKGNSLLYSKRLIELSVEVLAANSYTVVDQRNYPDMSYVFHLYYDNGQLFADRDFEFKYDVVPGEYLPPSLNTDFPYRGEVVNLLNRVAVNFEFDPRLGDPSFRKGKISVKAPYVPDGQKAIFYDSQERELLVIFVSDSSYCNDDGFCNTERGENDRTCPNDCRGVLPPASPVVEGPASGQEGMLVAAIYVLIIAGMALGGWFGWRWWKDRQEPTPMQFPQNPNVQ